MMLSNRLVSRLSHPFRILSRSATTSSESASSSISVTKTTVATPAPQAPNYPTKWSTSQRSRPVGGESPRFEQTAMDLQPQPLSAMEMINAEPIRIVHGRKAVCDGGKCSWMTPAIVPRFISGYRRWSPGTPEDFHQLGMYPSTLNPSLSDYEVAG